MLVMVAKEDRIFSDLRGIWLIMMVLYGVVMAAI
jgi:hypothetical protein